MGLLAGRLAACCGVLMVERGIVRMQAMDRRVATEVHLRVSPEVWRQVKQQMHPSRSLVSWSPSTIGAVIGIALGRMEALEVDHG